MVPEVAPGGDGTRFGGKCRVAAGGRAAALPGVRRGAGAVGSCAAAAGGDALGLEGVLAAAGQVPGLRADACAFGAPRGAADPNGGERPSIALPS